MKRKIALITGITGQDGAYLAEFLLDNGYRIRTLREGQGVVMVESENKSHDLLCATIS